MAGFRPQSPPEFTARTARADALVVDNADASVQITGDWQSNSMTPGLYGGDYLFSRPANGSSVLKWRFLNGGASGRYTFRPGEGLSVSLSVVVDGIVIADAISWVGPLTTGNVNIEPGRMTGASQLQRTIDESDQPWRLIRSKQLEPMQSRSSMAPDASFDLISVGTGVATVRAQQGGTSCIIDVVQPHGWEGRVSGR